MHIYAFHHTDSKDPDIHVWDEWMPATTTYPTRTIHKDECGYLSGWITKTVKYAKISLEKGERQRYSWGTQKKKGVLFKSRRLRNWTLLWPVQSYQPWTLVLKRPPCPGIIGPALGLPGLMSVTWARMHHKVVRHYFQSCQWLRK